LPGNPTNRREEVERIFGRVLPLIDSALLQHYGLSRSEATEVEDCLHDWFHGFVRRPGTPCTLAQLRPHLLAMACNAGHVYWSGKIAAEVPLDGNVQRSLTLGPQRIAVELERTQEARENPGRHFPEEEH
jgi:hypothetical protein